LFWAEARQKGQPKASDKTIDGDMISIAKALVVKVLNGTIAKTNVIYLFKFFPADLW
jgi:hypothetical protein